MGKYVRRIQPRNTMAAYLNQIDEIFTAIEQKTKVQRKFIGLGGVFIAMGLIMTTLAPLVVNVIAFAYPAFKSIKALESNNKEDDTKWLTYWVVYGVFSVAEFFTDWILSWFPFYYLAKMLIFVWCMAPIQANGSQFIYSHVILPWFLKNEDKLDKAFDRSKKLLSDAADEAEKVAKKAASDALLKED